MWSCNPLYPADPRTTGSVAEASSPSEEFCHGHTKYRQTPSPQESRSKHERDYDCCWETQHVIDVQAHAIHNNNVINYIFLFDRRAGVSDVCGWMSLWIHVCHHCFLWLIMTGGSLRRWGEKPQMMKLPHTPPKTLYGRFIGAFRWCMTVSGSSKLDRVFRHWATAFMNSSLCF